MVKVGVVGLFSLETFKVNHFLCIKILRIFYYRPKMSGHRWSAMKFQNVWDILLIILGPCFYIFVMEKLPKLKKIQLPKSQV